MSSDPKKPKKKKNTGMYVAQQDPGKNVLQNSATPNSPQVN
jgi:hypothetical protein